MDTNTREDRITHTAIVKQVNNNVVEVVLENPPGCDGCNAKASCGLNPENQSDDSGDSFFIPIMEQAYQPGEKVELSIAPSLGLKAVLWGYIIPFILLLVVLVTGLSFFTELIAGIAALSVVALFYLVLFFNKDRMKKSFAIDLKKLGS